ncbi:LytR/AlgR family response regulator transcription factor [Neolewinella agarilytica]|uniref:Two component transcriptional regulator, LytTR family n=1 Tax=Neolewinella agarilytica TaxID=478744 RepID=A0A1H9HFG7_9BACT|nr:response regulator transcription factor [Neolewinella agarilytica]SEQ61079.1 two component transcriptional regulator, LytTR family [Neolewinella agarilytica]
MTTTLLLDDEPHALELLEYHLQAFPNMKIVGRCTNLASAIKGIRDHRPQLVFLDIEVNRQEIYPLLEEVALMKARPAIIFVTAYAKKHLERIMRACSQRFVYSYLSKPIEAELLAVEMERYFAGNPSGKKIAPLNKLAVSHGNSRQLISFDSIAYAEASGNYAEIYYLNGEALRRVIYNGSMVKLEAELPFPVFYRMSNKHLINTRMLWGTEENYSVCLLKLEPSGAYIHLSIPERKRKWFRERM